MSVTMAKKSSRYRAEIERIEERQALDRIMKKEEIEGAMLSSPSSGSETVNDNIIDRILHRFKINNRDKRDLEKIERHLTMSDEIPVKRHSPRHPARHPMKKSSHPSRKGATKATAARARKKGANARTNASAAAKKGAARRQAAGKKPSASPRKARRVNKRR